MKTSPSTCEIAISSSINNDSRLLAEDEGDDEGNIEVSVQYNSDDESTSSDRKTRSMDPLSKYHDKPRGGMEDDDGDGSKKSCMNSFRNESNPADCSTILSECFSGEDTAEATTATITNSPFLAGEGTQPSFFIQRQDGNSNVVVSPALLRYFNDENGDEERAANRYVNDLTSSSRMTTSIVSPLSPSSQLITKRYPKDPTTTPNRPPSTNCSVPSMNMGTNHHTIWDHSAPSKSTILDRYRSSVDPVETNTILSSHKDDHLSSVHPMTTLETKANVREIISTKEDDRDDDGEEDDEEEELSWRMSPDKSMSDWTIEIQTKIVGSGTNAQSTTTLPSNTVVQYHVHKSVLAVGPRRSQYFVKLFRSNATAALSTTNTTITTNLLEMDELTALAFPILLDYMYGTTTTSTTTIPITTYNATALHVLAQQLEMKHLRTIVRNFWMQDLSMENIAIYYQHASSSKVYQGLLLNTHHTGAQDCDGVGGGLDDPLIIRALEMYCAQHMFDVDSGKCTIADILDILDPQFLYNVIVQAHDNNEKYRMMNRSRDDNENTFSLRLSLIIAVYCNIHYETDLDVTMFQQLTDRRHLPVLESQAAKVFLELQERLLCVPNSTVASLTDRCISVLANNWDTSCIKKQEHISDSAASSTTTTVVLPRLQSIALETFVSQAFMNATERIEELESNHAEVQTRNVELKQMVELAQSKVNTLEEQNQELQLQLRELQKEMKSMKESTDTTDHSSCNGNSSKTTRGRQTLTTENNINGTVHVVVEYTDDNHMVENNYDESPTTIETSTRNLQTSRVQQQQQQQQRNAIDHGRLLLQRLDSPATNHLNEQQ